MKKDSYAPPFVDPEELKAANARCDAELRGYGVDPYTRSRVGSAWKPDAMIVGGELTERKIERYAAKGWYSEDFKAERKRVQKQKRFASGNFIEKDGRMVYSIR